MLTVPVRSRAATRRAWAMSREEITHAKLADYLRANPDAAAREIERWM